MLNNIVGMLGYCYDAERDAVWLIQNNQGPLKVNWSFDSLNDKLIRMPDGSRVYKDRIERNARLEPIPNYADYYYDRTTGKVISFKINPLGEPLKWSRYFMRGTNEMTVSLSVNGFKKYFTKTSIERLIDKAKIQREQPTKNLSPQFFVLRTNKFNGDTCFVTTHKSESEARKHCEYLARDYKDWIASYYEIKGSCSASEVEWTDV